MAESGELQDSCSTPPVVTEVVSSVNGEHGQPRGQQFSGGSRLVRVVRMCISGWIVKEVVLLCRLAIPIFLSVFLQQLTLFVSLLYVGHITSDRSLELDSAALAIAFINVSGLSFGSGLATAGDTLCAQTYGSKNYKRVGHIFQRGVLILFVLTLFIWCVWLNTETILLLFQQKPCVARFTSDYIKIFCIALPAVFVYYMLLKYLQAQSVVWPFILAGIITNILSAALHAILIFGARLGINGAALAMVFASYCLPLFLIIYVWARKLHKETWDGWSWESLREWWQFLKLGLPGIAMISLEWISYEIGAFVVGTINETELAINAVMINVLTIAYMVPLGIATALSVRVGNELGAGQPQRAKRSALVGIAMTFSFSVLLVVFFQATKYVIGRMFTNDEAVLERIPLLIDVTAPVIIFDHTQGAMSGALRGCGRQVLGACVNFVSFYIFGLPVGISLALATELNTVGMWIGLGLASVVQSIVFSTALILTNWKKQAMKASERANAEKEETDSVNSDTTIISEELDLRGSALIFQEEKDDCGEDQDVENTEKSKEELKEEDGDEDEEDVSTAEEAFLVEESAVVVKKRAALVCCQYPRTKVGLLLCRGSLFVLGAALVIGAGVSSQYHPPVINGNYSECSANDTNDDELVSTVLPIPMYSETDILPSTSVSLLPTPMYSQTNSLPSVLSTSLLATPIISSIVLVETPSAL